MKEEESTVPPSVERKKAVLRDGLIRNGFAHSGRETMINGETGQAYQQKFSLVVSTTRDFTTWLVQRFTLDPEVVFKSLPDNQQKVVQDKVV